MGGFRSDVEKSDRSTFFIDRLWSSVHWSHQRKNLRRRRL